MRKFEKPKIYQSNEVMEPNYTRVSIEPLEKGFGTTLGNALRRVLLSSIPGASMYAIEVEGARHEFSALEGIREDVTSIVLNLKGLILKINDDDNVKKELKISVKGPKVVTAADIICPGDVEVVNKDLYIATVSAGGTLNMTIYAKNGRGYVTAENYRDFFPKVILSSIKGTLDSFESRMASLLFKLAVEVSVLNRVTAATVDTSELNLPRIRANCVRDVQRTQGIITLAQAVEDEVDK